MTIRVVTDSGADLPASLIEEFGIALVPLSIRFGEEEFIDQETLSTSDFWDKVLNSTQFPETAAPSPGRFESTFRQLHAEGATGIVCVSLSSAISATMQAAVLAARAVESDIPVSVIDSRQVSLGLSLLTRRAAELAQLGHDLASITTNVEHAIERSQLFGLLDTLEFLHRGGRIGGAKKMLGSMLSIKPVIRVEDGHVEEATKVRTRAKGVAYLIDQLRDKEIESVGILHSMAPDIDSFTEAVTEVSGVTPLVNLIGPVVGTHIGPQAIGLTFIESE